MSGQSDQPPLSGRKADADGDADTQFRRRLERNISRLLVLAFFQVFMVLMPVIVLFFESRGLSLSEVLLLQAWFAAVVLVMEVPSGYLADLLGRKQVMVVGGLFLGLGNTVLLFASGFWQLALFEASLGIGYSLISGADLALLYDTELALKEDDDRRQKAVGRLFTARNLSEALAAFTCSLLLLFALDLAMYAQVLFGWVPVFLAFSLVEPPRKQMAQASHMENVGVIFRHLLANGHVLRLTFLALSIWSLTTMYAVWLLQKHWHSHGLELVHYGYLWGALTLVSAASGKYALDLERRFGSTLMLLVIGLGPVLGYLGLGALGLAGGLLASTTFFACRGFGLVILRDALNRRVPSEFRATANSLASFGFRGAFLVTAPLVGAALDLWGMQTTIWLLAASSLVIFAALVLPLIAVARGAQVEPGQSDEPIGEAAVAVER